jgi:uroporphyrin-III C-methyltransferase/precorrin-2 dehydrogenase/sirohydrochlorin ferrochelatase
MRYFPLFLDLHGRCVVVVGGGIVAERKVEALRSAGAAVRLVAPSLTAPLVELRARGLIEHRARPFTAGDLDGAHFAIAATDVASTNHAVAAAAAARGLFVNVVDNAKASSAIVPAIVDRSPIVVAVSTAGTAPALARHVRAQLEAALEESLGALARFCAAWRGRIKARVPDLGLRRRLYAWLLDGPVARLLRDSREGEAAALLEQALAAPADHCGAGGSVTLVGAGPGDPGLLTLNALRALQAADVVFHDRLVSREVLALARREAELVAVGKSAGGHRTGQDEINAQLVAQARLGRRVVRLKGGDPFVFGRGGEELQYLKRAGVSYEVVPGITAALGCAAYAGIPLTHRDHAGAVRLVTAHCKESVDTTDWRALAAGRETLVVYMGVALLGTLRAELIRHGRLPATPAALVENGSRPDQRVVIGTLASIEALATSHRIGAPALLIVGEVAALGAELGWFGDRPLTEPGRIAQGWR